MKDGKMEIGRRRGGGIFMREVRAGFPTVAALAGMAALFAGLGVFGEYLRENYHQGYMGLYGLSGIKTVWMIIAIILFLTMGVLCGGEEIENGTADFALRLPVTRLRLYAAKTCGALFNIALWFVLAGALIDLIIFFGVTRLTTRDPFQEMIYPGHQLAAIASYGMLLFFCGQAAGAWTGRVIVGAIVAGVVAVILIYTAFEIHHRLYINLPNGITAWHMRVFVLASLAPMLAALIRFQTRQGR